MVMHQAALGEWTIFLETLRNRLEEARIRLTEAEVAVGRLEAQAQAVQDSIAAFLEHHDIPVPNPPQAVNGQQGTLTARRRAFLQDTARQNGGRLILRQTRDRLIHAGLFRDVKQWRQQIGRILEDMDCWERVRGPRGIYRLISPNGAHSDQ